jgi:hypothetical protein
MQSSQQGNKDIRFTLYDNPNFTGNANAVCDYTITGTFNIDGGAINQPYTTIMANNDHNHTYDTGSNITGFTISSVVPVCPCVFVVFNQITPTPSATPTQTPTSSPQITPSPSGTPNITPTPTSTSGDTGAQLFVYAKYINNPSPGELQYSKNSGTPIVIGEISTTSCDYLYTITGLQIGDDIEFSDTSTYVISSSTTTCPSGPGGFGCSTSYSVLATGTQYVYLTIDGSTAC